MLQLHASCNKQNSVSFEEQFFLLLANLELKIMCNNWKSKIGSLHNNHYEFSLYRCLFEVLEHVWLNTYSILFFIRIVGYSFRYLSLHAVSFIQSKIIYKQLPPQAGKICYRSYANKKKQDRLQNKLMENKYFHAK